MLKVLELFSGIGSQTQALKNIGIDHISTQCDIDKYAVDSYNQLHGETTNLGDISKINPDDLSEGQWDLITYSSPCQDFSIAGKMAGGDKDSGTRSSLLWECEKIIRKVKPKYLLMENVKNLVSKKFLPCFENWLKVLDDMGYKSYWKVLNAKDFGIPQNRERVFCVSILGEHKPYKFPDPKPLTLRLKDMLEEKVDERYYLNDENIKPLLKTIQEKLSTSNNELKEDRLLNIYGEDKGTGYAGNVWNDKGLCPALKTMQGGNQQPLVVDEYEVELPNGKKAKIDDIEEATCFKEVRTELGKQIRREARQQGLGDTTPRNKDTKEFVPQNNGLANCLMTGAGIDQMIAEPSEPNPFRIRKLTPRECWRLMGWTDEQIDKVKGISNCQLYKQAGNSIVVNVLEEIFRNMFLT